ncbi:hypothetical protein J2S53_001278 [Actinopolyspora lacussalsi]|nr:hypothetical protein [Actinopolyspora lacussalsi]
MDSTLFDLDVEMVPSVDGTDSAPQPRTARANDPLSPITQGTCNPIICS